MRRLLIAFLLFGLSLSALAAGSLSIDCSVSEKQAVTEDNVYKDVYDKAIQVCLDIKENILRDLPLRDSDLDSRLQQIFAEFGAYAAQALKKDFGNSSAIQLNENVDQMQEQLARTRLATGPVPEFHTAPDQDSDDERYLGYFTTAPAEVKKFGFPKDHEDCQKVRNAKKNCLAVFEDFAAAFNVYRKAYDQFVTGTNKQLLNNLNRDWDRFLDISKSQTAPEVWLTTWWHSDHFKTNHIVGPPSSQVIALHPQLVYEYVNSAEDGNNAEFGLAVEWLGINFWNQKVPFGFSVASVYTDRLNTPDVRTGVMLHIDNKYSIGWGYRDGEDSIYFSMDLLTLFQSKKQQFLRYNAFDSLTK
ncbi:MAG TPA: hypothetical protein VIM41_09670 [Gammaproteobacteria bacterium]